MEYFAGLFDAEGYVSLGQEGRFHIGTEMANEEIPLLFKSQFGGNIYPRKRDKRKKTWAWIISTNKPEALNFIERVVPFCIIKSTQLRKLRDYLNLSRLERRAIRDEVSHQISGLKNPFPFTKQVIEDRCVKPFDEHFWKWFAGFMDGDGNLCVFEYKGKNTILFDSWIGIFNIHAAAICNVHDRIIGSISQYKGSKFPIWKWVCNQKDSEFVCDNLYPFLKIKKGQCALVKEFLEIKKTKTRETSYSFDQTNRIRDIIQQIKHLNSL